jgi:hypothetical protein
MKLFEFLAHRHLLAVAHTTQLADHGVVLIMSRTATSTDSTAASSFRQMANVFIVSSDDSGGCFRCKSNLFLEVEH